MELIDRAVDYTGYQQFRIHFIGDTHIGTGHHDRKLWLRDIQCIKDDPNALWVHMGDAVEAISLSDPRFAPEELMPQFLSRLQDLPSAQMELFVQDVWDIADKCIGLSEGNHENTYLRHHYGRLTATAAAQLNVPYLSDMAYIRLAFRHKGENDKQTKSYIQTIHVQHGCNGGGSLGNAVNSLEKFAQGFSANIYAKGHVHHRLKWQGARLSIPTRGALDLVDESPFFVLSGSYSRTYEVGTSGYGQRKTYKPSVLGGETIHINPIKCKTFLEVDV